MEQYPKAIIAKMLNPDWSTAAPREREHMEKTDDLLLIAADNSEVDRIISISSKNFMRDLRRFPKIQIHRKLSPVNDSPAQEVHGSRNTFGVASTSRATANPVRNRIQRVQPGPEADRQMAAAAVQQQQIRIELEGTIKNKYSGLPMRR